MLSLESLFCHPLSNIRGQERRPGASSKRNGIQEVVGSIPISSTINFQGVLLGGFFLSSSSAT
jgi:hypothetical protein